MISPRTCPICQRDLPPEISGESPLFPFCSLRCKQVDLYHWFNGDYVIEQVVIQEEFEALGGDGDGADEAGDR